jgi:hypothetical protein
MLQPKTRILAKSEIFDHVNFTKTLNDSLFWLLSDQNKE